MSAQGFPGRCLPGDVEVLTETGWRRGVELREGDRVATWDPAGADITLEAASEVETGRYDGTIVVLTGAAGSATGNPERGVWVRTAVSGDGTTWTRWHRRRLEELSALGGVRIAMSGHHSGPGLRRDAGDYAGVLGWVSVEEGYFGTSIQIRPTELNHQRAAATGRRLAAVGASRKRTSGQGGSVDAWFLPGPVTASMRHDLAGGVVGWPAVWAMTGVELNAFVDGAAGSRHATIESLATRAVDVVQAICAMTGRRTTAHDVGRRTGASLDIGLSLEAAISAERMRDRTDTWTGPAFALTTRTGAVIARRNRRVFVAAT